MLTQSLTGLRTLTADEIAVVAGGFSTGNEFGNPDGSYSFQVEQFNYYNYASTGGFDVHGGAPWMLGVNPWVPDALENWWYGRVASADGMGAWAHDGQVWTYWDNNGDLKAIYEETTRENATKEIKYESGTGTIKFGPFGSTGGTATETTYLRPYGS